MKNYLFVIYLLVLGMNTSFGQQNQGTYIGSKDNIKIVAFIKNTNGFVLGYLYESRKTYHTLTGITVGSQVKGTMIFSGLKEFDCEGIFKGDSVYFVLNAIDKEQYSTIAMKKVSNQTKVNLDKYFGSENQENDKKLVGEWLILSDYDLATKKHKLEKDFTSMVLRQNGTYDIVGHNEPLSNVLMNWYTQDSTLFVNFKTIQSSRELNLGKYVINGDTLITTRGHIIKYLRKK